MRAIDSGVKELVAAETGHVAAMPVEKLARTQALFLYQIIRLLHGDVTLRAQGESDIALLQAWLGDLCKVRENLGDAVQLAQHVKRNQAPKWEVNIGCYMSSVKSSLTNFATLQTWIFAESVRRTVIMAYSFLKIYEMMQGPEKGGLKPPSYLAVLIKSLC